MPDYVTRDEHNEAVRRLDEADAKLRDAQVNLEREIRRDYEGKIASAVSDLRAEIKGVRDDVKESSEDLKGRVREVKEGLGAQNKWALSILGTVIALTLVALVAHYVFGISPA